MKHRDYYLPLDLRKEKSLSQLFDEYVHSRITDLDGSHVDPTMTYRQIVIINLLPN